MEDEQSSTSWHLNVKKKYICIFPLVDIIFKFNIKNIGLVYTHFFFQCQQIMPNWWEKQSAISVGIFAGQGL